MRTADEIKQSCRQLMADEGRMEVRKTGKKVRREEGGGGREYGRNCEGTEVARGKNSFSI